MKLLLVLLKLYPQAWRERYEEEMVALLEEHNITFFTLIDLLFGALDARLDPHYRTQRVFSASDRMSRIRLANSAILWIFPLFWLCWNSSFGRLLDSIVILFNPLAQIAADLFRIGFATTMISVLLSSLFVAFVTIRKATSTKAIIRFIPLAFFLLAGISYLLAVNTDRVLNELVFIGTLFISFLLTSIILAKGNILQRVQLPLFILTIIATVGMIVQLVAVTLWSSTLFPIGHVASMYYIPTIKISVMPQFWAYSYSTLPLSLGLMALLTLVAVFVLVRGLLALMYTHKVAPKEETVQAMSPLMQ